MPNPHVAPVVMDLGDFVPEEQEITFGIAGHRYRVRFSEATVDEVFAMIANEQPPEGQDGAIVKQRAIVSRFLGNHLADGDKDQLAEDLKLLPYSHGEKLSILELFQRIQLRVKKKRPWGTEQTSTVGATWMLRQVAFLMRASKGGLSHSEIMSLSWRQFQVYLDSFTWLLREESKEGQQKNQVDDMKAMLAEPRVKDWKRKLIDENKARKAKRKPRDPSIKRVRKTQSLV